MNEELTVTCDNPKCKQPKVKAVFRVTDHVKHKAGEAVCYCLPCCEAAGFLKPGHPLCNAIQQLEQHRLSALGGGNVTSRTAAANHAKAASPRQHHRDEDVVTLLRQPKKDERVSAQARGIIAALTEAKGHHLTIAELVNRMKAHVETVQNQERIFRWHRPMLLKDGFIKIGRD